MVRYSDSRPPQPRPPQSPLGISRKWGRLDYPALTGHITGRAVIRLIVFRPGTTASERRWAGAWSTLVYRQWGLVALMPLTLFALLLFNTLTPWARLIPVAAAAAVVLLTTWLKAHPTLAAARGVRIEARASRDGGPAQLVGDKDLFEDAAARLHALDQDDPDPVDYEARWAEIYEWLAAHENPAIAKENQR